MEGFRPQISRIKGLSDKRRLPRLNTIRLGIKKLSPKTGKEYPTETDYFVCPEEVRKVYGDQPTELEVMIPINDIDSVFPTSYNFYGSGKGLKCKGDGEFASRVNETTKEMEQVVCPCQLLEDKKCKQVANLMVMIPKVSVGGIYQIRTSSYNSIVDIQSGLDYVSALVGRFAMIPLKLRRVKTETHHDGQKQNHYTMQIILDANIDTINQLRSDSLRVLEHQHYQLPPPLEENPELDEADVIDIEIDAKKRKEEEREQQRQQDEAELIPPELQPSPEPDDEGELTPEKCYLKAEELIKSIQEITDLSHLKNWEKKHRAEMFDIKKVETEAFKKITVAIGKRMEELA